MTPQCAKSFPWGQTVAGRSVAGFGHRVVHGGLRYDSPVRMTQDVLDDLARLAPLAPLHQPHNLAPIRTILNVAPQIPQVACFDTAFHRSQSHLAQAFALPRRFTDTGVRRYGFHGISYEFLVARFGELAPTLANARIVFAHLGNGASMCAVKDGRSVATTMDSPAVDGLMMGTRCGTIDPGVVLYLMQEEGMDAAAIETLIYRQSGLLGVSGVSSDMRALRASSDPAAAEAIALFVYRIVRELGSLVAALGGLDALVFSGGIGENDAMTRAEVVSGSQWIGAALDPDRNSRGDLRISADDFGRFGLGRPDRRGATHRAPYGSDFVVKATMAGYPIDRTKSSLRTTSDSDDSQPSARPEAGGAFLVPPLLDDLPGRVGIVLGHRGSESGGVRPEVLLVNDAVLAADKSLDAAVAVGGRPGDHGVACDHVAVDEVGKGAARRRRPLRGEDAEVSSRRKAPASRPNARPDWRLRRIRQAAKYRPDPPAASRGRRGFRGSRRSCARIHAGRCRRDQV